MQFFKNYQFLQWKLVVTFINYICGSQDEKTFLSANNLIYVLTVYIIVF